MGDGPTRPHLRWQCRCSGGPCAVQVVCAQGRRLSAAGLNLAGFGCPSGGGWQAFVFLCQKKRLRAQDHDRTRRASFHLYISTRCSRPSTECRAWNQATA